MVINASGSSVKHALSAARKLCGYPFSESREVIRSGGEDGLYRCTLENGAIVQVTIFPRSIAQAFAA